MKILLIFLIFVMFLGTFFLADSNALIGPAAAREDPSLPEISLQIQHRNSDGVLVTYIEPSIFYLRNVNMIHEFLDAQENKTIIIIDGKSYEQIKFEFEGYFTTSGNQRSGYNIGWEGLQVLNARHNGYITEAGDTITASWKIIRTIQ